VNFGRRGRDHPDAGQSFPMPPEVPRHSPTPPAHVTEKRSAGHRLLRWPAGIKLTLPALLFVFAFMVYPIVSLVYLSIHEYAPLRSTVTSYVGLENYDWLVNSELVRHSIWVTLKFTAISVLIEMVVGLLVAVLLAKLMIGARTRMGTLLGKVLGGAFILPFAAPAVVAAIAWKMLLHPQFGPVDALLGTQIAWLVDFPLASIVAVDAWKMMPFVLFILFAAVMSVEPGQYESAQIDGATGWQEFRYITLPSIMPVVAVIAAFRAVDAFTKVFDTVFMTTGGGPGTETLVFPLLIWKTAFDYLNFGRASALAVIAVLISAFLGVGLLALRRSPGK